MTWLAQGPYNLILYNRFGDICYCCSYTSLPGPPWVVLITLCKHWGPVLSSTTGFKLCHVLVSSVRWGCENVFFCAFNYFSNFLPFSRRMVIPF